jgi:hypothetical protein
MRIVLEFHRGPRDGQVLAGDASLEPHGEAVALYNRLNGDVGEDSVWVPSDYAVRFLRSSPVSAIESAIAVGCRFPGHVYQVMESRFSCSEARLRLVHRGASE